MGGKVPRVRYSAAYPTRAERFALLRVERVKVVSRAERAEGPLDVAIGSDPIVPHGNQEVQVIRTAQTSKKESSGGFKCER